MPHRWGAILIFSLTAWWCVGQEVQVSRQNKTIAVTAEESVEAQSEIAVLPIGYHNYGPTKDAAFKANLSAAESIIKSLQDAGVPAKNIETQTLHLALVEPDEKWTPDMKRERQFEAQQTWKITVPVTAAQQVLDLAVHAGADELDDIDWNVADPVALQAKAGAAALAKARTIADQMAKGLGARLGDLIYASNRAPVPRFFGASQEMVTVNASRISDHNPQVKLFPQKVKSDATVYAVFAIE
ncbi:MAG TPA: SIMPL domain-containing protein [Terriglobales bacterium]|jgi:hypothetical protein